MPHSVECMKTNRVVDFQLINCSVDNSEFMRNSDFLPTRLQAQQEAVARVCNAKTRSNPENNVGLLTLSANPQVLATLTSDVGRILSKLHQVQPKGEIDFLTGIRIAHLTLKHRQGKNHKMRIVVFVGSPIDIEEAELVKVAKKLKKEKVNVDIVNFGEDKHNEKKLEAFISTLNGPEGQSSNLVTIPPTDLTTALFNSRVILGEDGVPPGPGGMDFDPNDDPELALALRVSMEEQRQRQEEMARGGAGGSGGTSGPEAGAGTPPANTQSAGGIEDEMLQQALEMSTRNTTERSGGAGLSSNIPPDFGAMTEDEQIAYALQMSMQQSESSPDEATAESESPMETDDAETKKDEKK